MGNENMHEPDYKGFGEHVGEWEDKGIPYGTVDLIKLAGMYHTPVPEFIYTKQEEPKDIPE